MSGLVRQICMRIVQCCGRRHRVPGYARTQDCRCPVCQQQIGTKTKTEEATRRDDTKSTNQR